MNCGDTWNTDGSMTKDNTSEVMVNKNASNKEEVFFPTLTLHYLVLLHSILQKVYEI